MDENLNVVEHKNPPVLSYVTLYRFGPPHESTTTFRIGDSMVIEFYVNDSDLDCSLLEVTEFSLSDAQTPNSPPVLISLPAQTEESTPAHSTSVVVSGDTGDYRLSFRLQDASGNWSNTIEIDATITEAGSSGGAGGGGGGGCFLGQLIR